MKMDRIGHVYEEPIEIRIGSGTIICYKDLKLKTNKLVYCQADIHYYEKNPKKIERGEIVNVIGCWVNFYGKYIRCSYDGKTFDIVPEYLDMIYEIDSSKKIVDDLVCLSDVIYKESENYITYSDIVKENLKNI